MSKKKKTKDWAVYETISGAVYTVDPPTKANAKYEVGLVCGGDGSHLAVPLKVAWLMAAAYNSGRRAVLEWAF